MAGNIGTVFVELSLDDKVYKEKLSQIKPEMEATAKGLETSWRVLSVKTNEYFDNMRRVAENAYGLILKSGKYASDEILRAEEAKNTKIKALNEQQYGTQTSLIDKLKSNWIAASVAIATAWVIVNKAMSYIEKGAKALQIESSFKIMADAAGVNSEKLIASMKAATKETVDDSALMQKAIKLMLAGYDASQIERFSEVVIASSKFLGTNVEEAYDKITDALATRMPKAMVQAGAVTKEQMKIMTEAIANGATQAELMELAIANLAVMTLKLQGTQDEATLSVQRFHTQIKETKEFIGKSLLWVVKLLYGELQELASGATWAAYGLAKLVEWSAKAAAWTADKLGFNEKAAALRRYADSVNTVATTLEASAKDLYSKAVTNITGVTETITKASKSEIDAAQSVVDALIAKLKAYKGANEQAKTNAEEAKKLAEDLANYQAKLVGDEDKIIEDYKQKTADAYDWLADKINETTLTSYDYRRTKLLEEYQDQADYIGWTEDLYKVFLIELKVIDDEEKAMNQEKLDSMLEAEQAYHDAVFDATATELEKKLDKWNEWYDDTIDILDKMELEDEKFNAESVRIWEIAQGKKIEALKDFAEENKTELQKLLDEWGDYGKQIDDLNVKIAEDMAEGFSDIFYDGITGKLKSLADYFKSIFNSILKNFTDILGQMAAKSLATIINIPINLVSGTTGTTSATATGTTATGLSSLLGYAGIGAGIGSLSGNTLAGTIGGVLGSTLLTGAGTTGMGLIGAELTSGLFSLSGGTLGASLGSIVPIIGTIIGAGIGSLIGELFGDDEEEPYTKYALSFKSGTTTSEYPGGSSENPWEKWSVKTPEGTSNWEEVKDAWQETTMEYWDMIEGTTLETLWELPAKWAASVDVSDMDDDEAVAAIENLIAEFIDEAFTGIDFASFQESGETLTETINSVLTTLTTILSVTDADMAEKLGVSWDVNTLYEDITISSKTYLESLEDTKDSIEELIPALDGLTGTDYRSKLEEISTLTSDYYDSMITYLSYIKTLSQTLVEDIASRIEDIRLADMTREEQIDYYNEQINTLYEQLITETDPTKIEDIYNQMVAAWDTGWGLMTAEEQAGLGQDSIDFWLDVEDYVAGAMQTAINTQQDAVDSLADILSEIDFTSLTNLTAAAGETTSALNSFSTALQNAFGALQENSSGVGSYASGLDNVPYNNFPARLHRNESVVTAQGNQGIKQILSELIDIKSGGSSQPTEVYITENAASLVNLVSSGGNMVIKKLQRNKKLIR